MFAAESYTSRHYIAIFAMACLCVLLGGPSYAAGAESLIIAGATYYEPGASGPGWAWTDADHLELNGYAGEAIGADGDLVLTLSGQNSVTESHAPDADITQCGMEVWGSLTLRGTGSLTVSGDDFVGTLEGCEGAGETEPGAVWRIGGLVEKPSPEAAPSNLYIVGRYLLSPLVMELLASQQLGKGGEIQLTDAIARSLDREAMYAVVIDPLSGWIATNALMAANDPRFAGDFWAAVDERGGLGR